MIQVKTAGGDVFEIQWIGVASIDGVLRFAVLNSDPASILAAFTKPENCETLTRVFDENELAFEGFTVFRGINISYDNSIIVSMSRN